MDATPPPLPPSIPPAAAIKQGWQPLPMRGLWVSAASSSLLMGTIFLFTATAMSFSWSTDLRWALRLGAGAAGFIGGAWLAWRRHRLTHWQLDSHALALRIGHLWQSETRVPLSRVQHLDVRRGPFQRMANLATLVVHTAGSRHSAVAVPNLELSDAEQLRDRLAQQLDHDDAL